MAKNVVIQAAHYGETEARLMEDPIVLAMAQGLADVPRKDLAHDDGGARFEFMQRANAEYRERGGKDGGHIGAVANALLKLLDAGVAPPTKVVRFVATRRSATAWRDEDVAMSWVDIYSGDDEDDARKALVDYMVEEATSKLRGKYASARTQEMGNAILAKISAVLVAEFEGGKSRESQTFEADGLIFSLTRTERDV